MTEIEQQNKALRIRYDGGDDTFHLQFPTWDKAALTYTEAGRLLSGEGAHPTATRGILACAMEADSVTLLVYFVVGSESFTTAPSVEPVGMAEVFPVLRYFTYEHLPAKLQKVSRPLCMMAYEIAKMYGEGADERELAKALDRLLEAKDAAVRAVV